MRIDSMSSTRCQVVLATSDIRSREKCGLNDSSLVGWVVAVGLAEDEVAVTKNNVDRTGVAGCDCHRGSQGEGVAESEGLLVGLDLVEEGLWVVGVGEAGFLSV